jgi:hypothetical protein
VSAKVAPEHYWKYRVTHLDDIPMNLNWAREVHWSSCLDKRVYDTQEDAIATYGDQIGRTLWIYYCFFCNGHHVTSHRYNEGYVAVDKAAARFLGRRPM